jgi:transcriptional regulator with XRE-family HTH domain
MEHVEEIRKLYAEGWLQRELAEKYGISQSNVSKIVSGISWPDPK